jgi:hypothetical protein
MSMSRISKNLGFTVPPAMAEEFEQLAREEHSTKSEMFRRMFRLYQSYRKPLKKRLEATNGWAERLILEAQEEERRNPLSDGEFASAIERAQSYGAERSKALGITSEEQVDEILYEDRQERQQAASRP